MDNLIKLKERKVMTPLESYVYSFISKTGPSCEELMSEDANIPLSLAMATVGLAVVNLQQVVESNKFRFMFEYGDQDLTVKHFDMFALDLSCMYYCSSKRMLLQSSIDNVADIIRNTLRFIEGIYEYSYGTKSKYFFNAMKESIGEFQSNEYQPADVLSQRAYRVININKSSHVSLSSDEDLRLSEYGMMQFAYSGYFEMLNTMCKKFFDCKPFMEL